MWRGIWKILQNFLGTKQGLKIVPTDDLRSDSPWSGEQQQEAKAFKKTKVGTGRTASAHQQWY